MLHDSHMTVCMKGLKSRALACVHAAVDRHHCRHRHTGDHLPSPLRTLFELTAHPRQHHSQILAPTLTARQFSTCSPQPSIIQGGTDEGRSDKYKRLAITIHSAHTVRSSSHKGGRVWSSVFQRMPYSHLLDERCERGVEVGWDRARGAG